MNMNMWEKLALLLAVLLVLCMWLFGCGYAMIHKQDIHEFQECYRAYRANVVPVSEPQKVNQLGDNLERTLEGWKGDWDADGTR